MSKENLSLLKIKHEINNILFKLETSSEILSEGNLSEEEYKQVAQILKSNIFYLKLLFENIFVFESLKKQKKEKINLQDFLGYSISKKYVEGYPLALSKAIQNLKDLSIPYKIQEKNNKVTIYIEDAQDKFLKYIVYITQQFFKMNDIEVVKEVKD